MQAERTFHQQLIDQNKEFKRQSIEAVTNIIGSVGREYHTVAIIGVQNSGKSTLLNFLFGTNFEVLHEIAGTRTTRGIWTSLDKQQNIIVFDVEGNDSMDRAQQQDYEKMVATYSLINAQVLIINVWAKTIGQYSGTQYQTLKVVMQICMTQFKQQSPKTILFCIRDFNDEYDNQGQCRRKIIKDVYDIWRKIQKPIQLQAYNQKPQKFFTIEVSVLKKYRKQKPQKFIQDVNKLRQKFINPKADGYVFAKQKVQYNLPIQDFPQLTRNSWNSIKTNKKLNLPNQKDQLANFRCSEIMAEIQHHFQEELRQLNVQHLVFDLGKLKQKYLTKYHQLTYHYAKNITEQKTKQLQTSISDQLKKISAEKLNIKTQKLMKQFQQESGKFFKQNNLNLDNQMNHVFQIKRQELINFVKQLNFQITDRKQRVEQLSKNLKDDMKQIKKRFLKGIQDLFQNQSSRTVRLLTSQLIKSHFGQNFWVQAKKIIDQKSRQLIQNYRSNYNWVKGEQLNPIQYGEMEQKIRNQSRQCIKSELQKNFQNKVMDQFKLKFNRDQNNGTINFNLKTQQEISQHFDKTRQNIITLIAKMNQYNESPKRVSVIQGMDQENTLFQSTWLSNITEQIDKQMISQFEKTIRRKKQGQMNEVPWWMFLLILYFVYDDIWFTQEESPIIHYTLVVVLLVTATLFAIGQGKIVKETIRMGTDKLKQKFAFLR